MLSKRLELSSVVAVVLLFAGTYFVLDRERLTSFLLSPPSGSSDSDGVERYSSLLSSALYLPPVELEFIHIPKTGGTSIELWGKANGFRWGKYDDSFRGDKKSGKLHCNRWHLPQNVSMESFCVVRQPFERLQSEFRHRTCEKNSDMPCDIRTFNDWTRNVLSGRLDVNDCHLLPQAQYLSACDNVLGFDYLQSQFTAMLSSMGFDGNDTELEVVKQPRKHARSGCDPECTIHFDAVDDDVRSMFNQIYELDLKVWDIYVDRRTRFLQQYQHPQQDEDATTTTTIRGQAAIDENSTLGHNDSTRGSNNNTYFLVRGPELAQVAARRA